MALGFSQFGRKPTTHVIGHGGAMPRRQLTGHGMYLRVFDVHAHGCSHPHKGPSRNQQYFYLDPDLAQNEDHLLVAMNNKPRR